MCMRVATGLKNGRLSAGVSGEPEVAVCDGADEGGDARPFWFFPCCRD